MPLFWNLRPAIQLAIATVIQVPWPRGSISIKVRGLRSSRKVLGMDLLGCPVDDWVIYIHSAYTALTVHQNVKLYFLSEGSVAVADPLRQIHREHLAL